MTGKDAFHQKRLEIKYSVAELVLHKFYQDYQFSITKQRPTQEQIAIIKGALREIAEAIGAEVPEMYGKIETDTEYGTINIESMATLPNRSEVL